MPELLTGNSPLLLLQECVGAELPTLESHLDKHVTCCCGFQSECLLFLQKLFKKNTERPLEALFPLPFLKIHSPIFETCHCRYYICTCELINFNSIRMLLQNFRFLIYSIYNTELVLCNVTPASQLHQEPDHHIT